MIKNLVKKIPFVRNVIGKLNNENIRDEFVKNTLLNLDNDLTILDAGCGSQRYRKYCSHLNYKAQDFGQYISDEKSSFTAGAGGESGYVYGVLDYVGDIWKIDEKDGYFDVILCTEVFEHIPYPVETVSEFSRLLKNGGLLILTSPSCCLRHMDPYFYHSGFSDRWFNKILNENGFNIELLEPIGDYYSWMSVEMARTGMNHGILSKLLVFPAFIYYYNKRKTVESVNTLCMGYHVLARKANEKQL